MSARLLLDIGNTRLKWTVADADGRLAPVQALAHDGDPAALVEWLPLPTGLTEARIANVAGTEAGERLAAALRVRHQLSSHFARPLDGLLGLHLAYAEPQRLGVDRWLALLAIWRRERAAACVASAGTALTFDAVDDRGRHLGGVIAPGLLTAQTAVLGATRFAADGPSGDYTAGLGRDTEACVRQGALHACAGLVERLAGRHPGARYLIGGDAALLAAQLPGDWQIRPDLVLEGLAALPV